MCSTLSSLLRKAGSHKSATGQLSCPLPRALLFIYCNKMLCGMFEAEKQVWRTPELVDNLLPFLDLQSTLHLAQNHGVTREVLQGSFAWNKLIKRTCVSDQNYCYGVNSQYSNRKVDAARLLGAILKLMRDPKANMLDLLDTICQRIPRALFRDASPAESGYYGAVTIGCPAHGDPHKVLLSDFLLLEEIEGAFGTTEQEVEEVWVGGVIGDVLEEPFLSALSSRLSRQQKKLTSIYFDCVELESKKSAAAFKTLMEASPEITLTGVGIRVPEAIGVEGWKALAEGVRLHPGLLLGYFSVLKDGLDEARKEDIRVVWDALETGRVWVDLDPEKDEEEEIEKTEGEAGWSRLVQIMEMSKDEWAAQFEKEEDEGGEVAGEPGDV